MQSNEPLTAPARLAKSYTGIEGFDRITKGGLPTGKLTLVVGGPGTGKTVFSLQTLVEGARKHGEPGIFVAFEENSRDIIGNAATFGWDLPELERQHLFFLDAKLPADTAVLGSFDLSGLLRSIEAKARQMQARRIVFDSLDVVLMLLNNDEQERRELRRLHEWTSESGLTCLITAKSFKEDAIHLERYGYLSFMTDCVVHLKHWVRDRVSLRELRVVKYRGSGFAENSFPYCIGDTGIDVAVRAPTERMEGASRERLPSGVERLDAMLEGGYYRGSSTLIAGNPGTAKSTLAANFLAAACERGERSLLLTFDETKDELVRNLCSVKIDLRPHLESGLLRIHAVDADSRGVDEHMLWIKGLLNDHRPTCMVVDPISAIIKAGGTGVAMSAAQRLMRMAKETGATIVCTSLLDTFHGDVESTPIQVSTLVDTWIHLSYLAMGGERNRCLTVVKSRGTAHSNQVRELVLTSDGITLQDVYSAGGDVLVGTARWEKEVADKLDEERRALQTEHRRQRLRATEGKLQAQIEAMRLRLDALRGHMSSLEQQEGRREGQQVRHRQKLRSLRRGDEEEITSMTSD